MIPHVLKTFVHFYRDIRYNKIDDDRRGFMFEQINIEKRKIEMGIIAGGLLIGLGFIFFLAGGMSGSFPGLGIVVFIGGGITSGVFSSKLKKLSTEFKTRYVEPELRKIFPNSSFSATNGFLESEVVESKLLKRQDRYKSEDMIEGEFEGVRFRSSDVHMQDVRRSGKHTTVVTVFQGRFYEFDFNKVFKHNLLLLQKSLLFPGSGYSRVKMESIHFNSELKVYAENDHEAFYILTPHFMEKLLELDRKYYDKISFSFLNNKLYIAVDNRVDNFDLKAFTPVSTAIFSEYVKEFNDMKTFITMLNLTSRLFKDF